MTPRPGGGFSFPVAVAKTVLRFAVRFDISARTLFLAGCFAAALAVAGFKPRPVQSGPLEDRLGRVAAHFVATRIGTDGGEPGLQISP